MSEQEYITFPSMVFGGGAGDYEIECPIRSSKWAEYRVLQIANSSAGIAQTTISGDTKPPTVSFTTPLTLSDDQFMRGEIFSMAANTTCPGSGKWQRITHSQKRVFARVDSVGGGGTYITIQFRSRVLTYIPGPIETVPPELSHQANIVRSKRVKDRLEKAGIPEKYGS